MKKIILISLLLIPLIAYGVEKVEVLSLKSGSTSAVVKVGVTATPLPTTALSGRKVIAVQNLSGSVIYIGASTITADTAATGGLQLRNVGDAFVADLTDDVILYGIVVSGSQPISGLEIR